MKLKIKGQSLFETVIALGLITVIAVTLLAVSTKSVSNSTDARRRSEAKIIAQGTYDWFREQRDTIGYAKVLEHSGSTYCLVSYPANIDDLIAGLDDPCDPNDDSDFITPDKVYYRQVALSSTTDEQVQLDVRVGWRSGGGHVFIESSNILADPNLF